jgi:tetratricopeptide (TPR) repeat protein
MPLTPGTQLGPYKILELIGTGGMGEVYRARDTRLHRDVAVKVLRPLAERDAAKRFQREALAASALSHPNICTIHDVGEAGGQPYIVMELLEGVTLGAHLGDKPLDPSSALTLVIPIAEALEAAHARGIVHRDIKPANVMITARKQVKVLDFGLAKHTAMGGDHQETVEALSITGAVMGTPQYLSPEVLKGSQADQRSDLWAFGVILYQMLTGQVPFSGASMFELSSSILKEPTPPLPADVPSGIRTVVNRCLAKDPADRYQSAGELRAALEALHSPAVAAVKGTLPKKWLLAAAGIVGLALAVFAWQYDSGNTNGARRVSTGGPASSVQEANDLFELAMNLMRVQNDVPKGIEMMERALALDPKFHEARRYLAFQQVILLLNGYTNDVNPIYKAEEELRRVEREAPELVSLPSAQAGVYMVLGRKELIPVARLNEVMKRDPPHNDTYLWRMVVSLLRGDDAEAKEIARQILEREPTFGAPRMFLGEILRREGDLQGAIREQTYVLGLGPEAPGAARFLALAYMDAGQLSEARRVLEERRAHLSNNYMWRQTMALLLALEGKRDEALQAMDPGTEKFARAAWWVATAEMAEFYAVLGDTTKAVDWIEEAVNRGDERVEWFRRNPRLAAIQKDERFLRMVEALEARRRR